MTRPLPSIKRCLRPFALPAMLMVAPLGPSAGPHTQMAQGMKHVGKARRGRQQHGRGRLARAGVEAGELRPATDPDADPTTARWSYRRDFGRVRLLMVDSRAARVLDEQDRELLWSELESALRLGCAQATDGEGKPYKAIPGMFVTGDDLDGFSTWVSLPGAVLRSKPNAQSQAKMRLPAWTVLGEVEHDGGSWIEVRTPKGSDGFVSTEQVRSLIDYRIIFGQRDGRWQITAFVAGD